MRDNATEEASYAQAIIESVSQPLLVLSGEMRVASANPAFFRHFRAGPETTLGSVIYDLGNRQWDIPELHHLLEEALSEDGRIENRRLAHTFADLGRRVLLLNANRIRRQGGSERILLAISDVTERERLLFELEGEKEFAEKLIDSVREALLVLHSDLRVHSANQSFYERFQVDAEETAGRLVYELGDGQWDIPALHRLLEDILPRKAAFDDYEVAHDFERIGKRVMLLNARRLEHFGLVLLAIRDITEQRQAETRQKTFMGELHHRVKNIIDIVRSLAAHTRQGSRSIDEFFQAFEARLGALARTQDLLVAGPHEAVPLDDIVRRELEAVGADARRHFTAEGPPVHISSRDLQAVAMTIHELATNAAKYGALTVPGARVEIVWAVERRNGQDHLSFHWRERGVPIADIEPPRGFGSRVIEESLPHMSGGAVELTFHPDGIACQLDFPLSR